MLQVSTWISEAIVNGEMEEAVISIILHAKKQPRLMVVLTLLFRFGVPFKAWALPNAIHSAVFSYQTVPLLNEFANKTYW